MVDPVTCSFKICDSGEGKAKTMQTNVKKFSNHNIHGLKRVPEFLPQPRGQKSFQCALLYPAAVIFFTRGYIWE